MMLGFLCRELCWRTFSTATKQKLTERDIMELILVFGSDAHLSEDEDISRQTDTDTDIETDDIPDTNCI